MTTPSQILDAPIPRGLGNGAETVREYLLNLLTLLWEEGEGFNSKRPFGFSMWEYHLIDSIARAGYVDCSFDEDGNPIDVDEPKARKIINEAIRFLGTASVTPTKREPLGWQGADG